jgi:hypothetical protein
MRNKLTKEIINNRLISDNRNVRMIGDYNGLQSKTMFTDLICGHSWLAMPSNVTGHRKSGCGVCSPTKKMTVEDIRQQILQKNNGIDLIGEYVDRSTKTVFKCSNDHIFTSTVNSVLGSKSCPECIGRYTRTVEEVNLLLSDKNLSITTNFNTLQDKITAVCSNGHNWTSTVSRIIRSKGCAHCQKNAPLTNDRVKEILKSKNATLLTEFIRGGQNTIRCKNNHIYTVHSNKIKDSCPHCDSGGFKLERPATAYIIQYKDFIKYGITGNIKTRLRHLKRNGSYSVLYTKYFILGSNAVEWEKQIKKVYGGSFADKSMCLLGYTETLPISLSNDIITNLKEYNND